MTADRLFDVPDLPVPVELSPGQRRTIRQRSDVEAGRHPLTGTPTFPELGTCGTCHFRSPNQGTSREYPKCHFGDGVRITRGAATDVRAWWPACGSYEPAT